MTQPTEPVKTDKKPGNPVLSSPKPKPAESKQQSTTPSGSSPKPKPAKTEVVNKVLSVNSVRLTPFESYKRTDSAPAGGSGAVPGDGLTGTKPFAKKRLSSFF
ncbi:MAG: hypothetical protein HGB36_03010 [Chlorobiaceae bacterium]|nr:hypothetical protein [Chlorobiaceae bacterium]